MSSSAYNGNESKNPFNFQPFGLNSIQYCTNTSNACDTYTLTDDISIEAFHRLALTQEIARSGNDIGIKDFANGYNIYVYDNGNYLQKGMIPPKIQGHSRLLLRFSGALKESVTLICYGTFGDQFKIDKSRAILLS